MSFTDRSCGWRLSSMVWAAAAHAVLLAAAASAFHVALQPGARREALRVATFQAARPAQPDAQVERQAETSPDRPRLADPAAARRPAHPASDVPQLDLRETIPASPRPAAPVVHVPEPAQPAFSDESRAKYDAALSAYTDLLRSRILAWRPRGLRTEGTVTVAFSLDRLGQVTGVRIATPSGDVRLDRLALRTVRQAAPFPPPPDALTGASLDFSLSIRFH